MLPKKYYQRLKALFRDLERVEADPPSTIKPMRLELDALRARLQELETEFLKRETLVQEAQPSGARPTPLDIYEKDRVGYVYARERPESFEPVNFADEWPDTAVSIPVVASGQAIGAIRISPPPERSLTPDEMGLAGDVVRQVSQQIQNLRLLSTTERARAEAETSSRRFVHEGWDSYLDAIRQNERIGYGYDQTSVTPYVEKLQADSGFLEPVLLTHEQIGALYLRTDPHRPLADEDRALVSGVARQLGQQVENLRLLADATRARAEAEAATRQMTRESWQSYTRTSADAALGFQYDSVQVTPFGAACLPPDVVLSQPLMVRGEPIGELAVAGLARVTPEGVQLAAEIAARASLHLETLRLSEELRKRAHELEELDRLKTAFLANMSHELRTPLNSILGFADVMMQELDGPLTENMNSDLQVIQKNGQHLLNLINDVLDMAKIEAGRMNLSPEQFKIHEVFDEVVSIAAPLASAKALSLFVEAKSDQWVEVFADRTRIRQVMLNLVNNALKFTETGKISICTARQDEKVLISVSDTGLGIPVEKLEIIFQEFMQVDTSDTRKVGGTGLGLPISRRLIDMHGGRMWAESRGIPGEGSTFYVELPLEARFAEPAEKLKR